MTDFEENGLLPAQGLLAADWLRPQGEASSGDDMGDALSWRINIAEGNRMSWPAVIDGELRPPPPAHVLDHLVRREFEGESDGEESLAFHLSPRASTVAVLDELPDCSYHLAEGRPGIPARYDAPIPGSRGWANSCPDCLLEEPNAQLGEEKGLYLMLRSEVPDEVNAALERVRVYWRRRIGGAGD